jgi:YD repeat-containing protein
MEPKIKTVTSFRALHTDGLEEEQIREKEYMYQRSEYDEQGHLLSEETFTADGSLEHKASYVYDEKGFLIEEILIEEDDEVSEHRTMEYDSNGRLVKEKMHYMDDFYDEISYSYDSEGNLVSKISVDSEGEAGNKVIFEYKGKNLVSEVETDSEGNVISSKHFEFDEAGNLIEEGIKSQDEEFEATYEYDDKGHRTLARRYNAQGQLVERNTYMRDAEGRLISMKEETVHGTEMVELENDEKGNQVLQLTSKESGELISRVERSYDTDNLLQFTQVYIEGSGQRLSQDYRLRFEYELY